MLGAGGAGQHGQVWATRSDLNLGSEELEDGSWENRGGSTFWAKGTNSMCEGLIQEKSSGIESRLTRCWAQSSGH